MNKKALSLAICLAMAIPTASNALSLGEIESKSSLNQPFQGKINLLQTNPSEVQSLRVRVASPEVFNRVGIDRPAFLNSIRFRTAVQNGRPVILVSSNQPINEPFLNFLLEVSWPNGQLLKEYTVLLDPPVLLRPNTAIASNNAGIRPEPVVQGRIKRQPQPTAQQIQAQRQRQAQQQQRQRQVQQQRRVQQQRQAQQAQRQTQLQRQAQSDSQLERQARQVLQSQQTRRVASSQRGLSRYRVRRGDTLSKVAKKLAYNGVRSDQMMVALFEKNRRAFSKNNMNNLKAGALMARPSVKEARSLSSRAARAQIIAQAREWKAKRATQIASRGGKSANKTAHLEVLGKSTGSSTSSSSAGNAGAVADLNKQLALLTESLTTRKQENTELQSRVTELESLLRKKNRLIALKSEQLATLQANMNGSSGAPQQGIPQSEQATQELNTAITEPTTENIGEAIQSQVADDLATENDEIVRTEPEAAIADNTIVEPDPVEPETNNAFKQEPEGMDIMGLITSPVGMGAGLGSLALLLGGALFMRRRKNKGEDFEDFSDAIDSGLNEQVFDEEQVTAEVDDMIDNNQMIDESEFVKHDEVQTQGDVSPKSEDELEDLIQEADVYIVYGLHDQAESEIKRALNTYPDNAALHAKLLENYKAAGNAEAFEEATKTYMNLEADDKQNYWEDICEWGSALLPESKLYSGSTQLAGVAAAATATGAAMVAGTAIAEKAADVAGDELIDDTILDEFDSIEVNNEVDDLEDLDDILDESENELMDIADTSDDFDIDLDDDFDKILDQDMQEQAEELLAESDDSLSDENIEDTDFLFDDESLEDMLNTDEESETVAFATEDAVDEATNLKLDVGAEDFDKIMPEEHAYKATTKVADIDITDEAEDNLLTGIDDNLSFLDIGDDAEVIGETQIETKIDLARAYMDMGDVEGARSTLEEVMETGSDEQKRQAEELLHQNG